MIFEEFDLKFLIFRNFREDFSETPCEMVFRWKSGLGDSQNQGALRGVSTVFEF